MTSKKREQAPSEKSYASGRGPIISLICRQHKCDKIWDWSAWSLCTFWPYLCRTWHLIHMLPHMWEKNQLPRQMWALWTLMSLEDHVLESKKGLRKDLLTCRLCFINWGHGPHPWYQMPAVVHVSLQTLHASTVYLKQAPLTDNN